MNAALTPFRVTTLDAQTSDSLARERLLAILSSYFGGFALLLASIGLYGLMLYSVTQRLPELSLRLALGAEPSSIRRMIVAGSARIVLAGTLAGFAAATLLTGFVESQLYEIAPRDPASLAAATAILLAVAFGATYLPARRASGIDPISALRRE